MIKAGRLASPYKGIGDCFGRVDEGGRFPSFLAITNLPAKEESDNSRDYSMYTRKLLRLTELRDFIVDSAFPLSVSSFIEVCTLVFMIPSSLWFLERMLVSLSALFLDLV